MRRGVIAPLHPLLMLIGGLLALLLVFATLTILVRTLPQTVLIPDLSHIATTLAVIAFIIAAGTYLGIGALLNAGRFCKAIFKLLFGWR